MDFPVAEYEQRTRRAQKLMDEAGIGALFFSTEPEIRYFTGFRTLFWQSPTRPWFCIVPKNGKPIAVIPEIGRPLMATCWIDDIRTWASPGEKDDGQSLLVDVLRPFATIGMPMGRESHVHMPYGTFTELREQLRANTFIDASKLVQSLRFVKSDAEIALIGEICRIASNAFDRATDLFQEGQPLREAFRDFKIELLKQGAEDVPYLVGGAGKHGYADVISPPSDAPLRNGDVFMLDTGATLGGYFCDFDRNFGIGNVSDEISSAHEILWQATEAGLALARPGTTCSALYFAMQKIIDGDGGVGRLGHGLGMQLTEAPSLIAWDETPLREGAVITLEPSITVSNGGMLVHEENIVIRDGAPQLLSRRAPREMPIVG